MLISQERIDHREQSGKKGGQGKNTYEIPKLIDGKFIIDDPEWLERRFSGYTMLGEVSKFNPVNTEKNFELQNTE